jgi:hypothetical protein
MAVVINEFEVVADSAQGGRGSSGATEEQRKSVGGNRSTPSAPTPDDIRRILRRAIERMARVRAD